MKHSIHIFVALLFTLLGLSTPMMQAQTPQQGVSPTPQLSSSPSERSEAARQMDEVLAQQERAGGKELSRSLAPDTSTLDRLDAPTREQAYVAMREYYHYRTLGFQHRMDVFRWQLFSSKIIFVVVILLVLAGVYFSGVQFHSSLHRSKAPAANKDGVPQPTQTEQHDVTEIEASVRGIRVSSPVLGVLILVISFLFFYLYLVYVYPIVDTL